MGRWELDALHAIQGLHGSVLDALMVVASALGTRALIWLVVAAVLLVFRRTRAAGAAVLIAVAAAELAVPAIKAVVMRPRPYMVDAAVALIVPAPGGWSFPSGHTTCAFACAAAMAASLGHARWKLWLPVCVLAAIVAFSRLYLFVHWPSDVAAGVVIGVALGAASALLVSSWGKAREGRGGERA